MRGLVDVTMVKSSQLRNLSLAVGISIDVITYNIHSMT